MKTVVAAAVLFAAPAIAQRPAEPTSAIIAPVAAGGPAATRVRATRYCVVTPVTGSLILNRVCRTRAAWMARGFDPLADQGR